MSKPRTNGFLSQSAVVGWVAGALLLLFGVVQGVPWASRVEHAKLESEVSTLRSELARTRTDTSSADIRITGHDTSLAELKASIAQVNAKLDALLQRR